MKEQTTTKLEFLMKVNNNIIVQRLFNIKDYNPKAKSSTDLYSLIRDFKIDLERELKMKKLLDFLQVIPFMKIFFIL